MSAASPTGAPAEARGRHGAHEVVDRVGARQVERAHRLQVVAVAVGEVAAAGRRRPVGRPVLAAPART
jgi:hypothetical protein